MRKIIAYVVAAAAVLVCHSALAQDAQTILETARQKQLERWQGVDAYVVEQSIMGQTTSTWFVRTELKQPDGRIGTVFLPMADVQMRGDQCGLGQMTDEDLATFSTAANAAGDAQAREIEDGLEEAGLPRGMLAATGSDPWNTMDPRVMMGGYSDFLTAAVHAQREIDAYDGDADAQAQLDDMNRFMESAMLVGKETIEGREAHHLRATGLNMVERSDGQEYRIDSMSLYIDAQEYVPLMMRVEGTMVSGNETQDMIIENIQTDYRQVPGSNLYESYRRVMKMSGMMTAAQEAEMAEARTQMAEFEKELASMPADQRRMMEQMMGPQLETMRNMAKGGGFQTEVVTTNIRVNPVRMDAAGQACPGSDNAALRISAAAPQSQTPTAPAPARDVAPASAGDGGVTKMVQEHLTTLGYNTGNTSGEITTETIVAISQFQAENNLPVTGEASPQLAGILAAKVSAVGSPPPRDPAALQAAQQACLQQKMEESQAAQKKKRGFGRLLSGVGRLAGQSGNFDLAQQTNDVYQAGATADDFAQAAKDLGLTEDQVAACQNPM